MTTTTTRRNRPEEQLHRTVAEYLDLALPKSAFWFHVPNGGARSKAEAGAFKAMGVKAGVPDICILYRGVTHFIELKPKGRYFSPAQKTTMPVLQQAGAKVWPHEARSIEDVQTALAYFGIWKAKRAEVDGAHVDVRPG